MHILILPSEQFLTERHPAGGIFQYDQALALSGSGHKVGILSVGFISFRHIFRPYLYPDKEEVFNISIYRSYKRSLLLERFVPSSFNRVRYVRIFKEIYLSYISKHGVPDIVHAHNFLYAGFLAEWIKDTYGLPFVLTEHSTAFARRLIPNRYDHFLKRVASKAGVVSCVSTPFKRLLEDRLDLMCDVLPNIVDSCFFAKDFPRDSSSNFIFLTVGLLDYKKNHELLLRSFAAGFKNQQAYLRIGSDGPLRRKLIRLARELGILGQVFFLGHLSRDDVVGEMQRANCFVLPSNHETFGVVLIEALASGLPLIATRCGGPEDIVNAGNGRLVDVGSVEQLASAMRYVKNNITKYSRDTLRNEASSHYSASAFVKRAIDFYERAIEKNSNY